MICGFVFSKDKRVLNGIGAYIGTFMMIGFASVFVYDLIMHIGDSIANILVVLFSLGVCTIMIVGSKQNSPLLSLQYSIEGYIVKNFTKHKVAEINIQDGLYFSELCLFLHSKGGGRWEEQYYLLSNYPIPKIPNHESGGLRLPRELTKSNVILLPASQSTNIWIKKTITDISIPQYPRIAYRPKIHKVN